MNFIFYLKNNNKSVKKSGIRNFAKYKFLIFTLALILYLFFKYLIVNTILIN